MFKTIIIFSLIFSINLYAKLTRSEIVSVINKIKQKRKTLLSNITIKTPNPFMLKSRNNHGLIDKNKNSLKTVNSFKLSAIINKSALINNKWYNLGDKINHFILYGIKSNYVIIKDNKNIKKLLIKKDYIFN